jgi:hypothetical protein
MRGYGIALILFQDEIVKIEDTVRKEIIEIIEIGDHQAYYFYCCVDRIDLQ